MPHLNEDGHTRSVEPQFWMVEINSVCIESSSESRRNSVLARIPCRGLRNSSAAFEPELGGGTLHVRDILLMKSDFILFAVIASKRLISTIIEFVNADR